MFEQNIRKNDNLANPDLLNTSGVLGELCDISMLALYLPLLRKSRQAHWRTSTHVYDGSIFDSCVVVHRKLLNRKTTKSIVNKVNSKQSQ